MIIIRTMKICILYLFFRHIIRASPSKEIFIKLFQVTDSCFIFTKEVHEWSLIKSIPNYTRCPSHRVSTNQRSPGMCIGSRFPREVVSKTLLLTHSSSSSLLSVPCSCLHSGACFPIHSYISSVRSLWGTGSSSSDSILLLLTKGFSG